jgi:hypothetical protein
VLSSLDGAILLSRAAKSVAPIVQTARFVLQIVRAKVRKP